MPIMNYTKEKALEITLGQKGKKSWYSDKYVAQMLESVEIETLESEPTREGYPLNRGTVVEQLLKAVINGFVDLRKTLRNADLKRSKGDNRAWRRELGLNPDRNYEIKFSTSYALASKSDIKTKQVIKVIPDGVYLVDASEYDRATYPQGQRLDLLSELLGF